MSDTAKDQPAEDKSSFEEEHLQECLEHAADSLNISSPKYKINSGTKAGDNYLGIIYRAIIEGENNGVPVKVQTIVKGAPTNETIRQNLLIGNLFPREHAFYTDIVPLFQEFLQTKNRSLKNVPACYFSSNADHKEVICLEDLRPKGFVMRDRMKQLDFPHASVAFRALGRLHALSFALRDQRPDTFASKITVLKDVMFKRGAIAEEAFISYFELFRNLTKTVLAGEESKYATRFSEISTPDFISLVEQSCDGNIAEPYAVLCHGDFWINNMLFKYEEDSEEPEDIYLLDFQMSRYASPATDLSFNLFCSCSHEVRANHFDELVKIYHDSLSAYLLELGSDPKKLFPFEALVDQLNKFSIYGAGMAMLSLHVITNNVDEVDTTRPEDRIHTDHFWRNSLRDAFKDLIDRNYM